MYRIVCETGSTLRGTLPSRLHLDRNVKGIKVSRSSSWRKFSEASERSEEDKKVKYHETMARLCCERALSCLVWRPRSFIDSLLKVILRWYNEGQSGIIVTRCWLRLLSQSTLQQLSLPKRSFAIEPVNFISTWMRGRPAGVVKTVHNIAGLTCILRLTRSWIRTRTCQQTSRSQSIGAFVIKHNQAYCWSNFCLLAKRSSLRYRFWWFRNWHPRHHVPSAHATAITRIKLFKLGEFIADVEFEIQAHNFQYTIFCIPIGSIKSEGYISQKIGLVTLKGISLNMNILTSKFTSKSFGPKQWFDS